MTFLLYMLLGAGAGTLAGLFGVGGGLIIVPVLIFSFTLQGMTPEVMTHLAVGTSLATIVFTSINSVLAHHKRGAVLWPVVLWLSGGIIIGSFLGGITAAYIPGRELQIIIGVFALLMSLQMATGWRPKGAKSTLGHTLLSIAGTIIGWASAIFGIGGGSLTVPFLTWRGVDMKQAVASAAAVGLPLAVSGALSFMFMGWGHESLPGWSVGYVYLPALVGIASTSMIFARFGAALAHKLDPVMLKRLFALLLLCVGLNFLL